jgi:hypothetical protein
MHMSYACVCVYVCVCVCVCVCGQRECVHDARVLCKSSAWPACMAKVSGRTHVFEYVFLELVLKEHLAIRIPKGVPPTVTQRCKRHAGERALVHVRLKASSLVLSAVAQPRNHQPQMGST